VSLRRELATQLMTDMTRTQQALSEFTPALSA